MQSHCSARLDEVHATIKDMEIHYDKLHKKLTIRGATEFPKEVFNYADELEILDLSNGHLTTLPDLSNFRRLRIAFFAHNDFEEIPGALATCESLEMVGFKSCKISTIADGVLPAGLRGLIVTDNRLQHLPDSIGKYTRLQKLMLAGNQLNALPDTFVNLTNLQLLRMASNNFLDFPDVVTHLPQLGWYSDAANPLHQTFQGEFKEISWNDIVLGEKIGESASNTVYKAILKDEGEVAVKLYGSDISTDGLPEDEMNACLLAGAHPNIIGGLGKLIDVPDGKYGFVMPLIPADYQTLGDRPDFVTLTRDVFDSHETFSLEFVTRVLQDVAEALSHCHQKGVMHGDIYAHNILSNHKGESKLGDFGAASLYQPGSQDGALRERIDVAGFGYLIEDLLTRTKGKEEPFAKLNELKDMCLNPEITR